MKISKNEIKREAKKRGLPLFGDFIVLLKNDDVVSGVALDGAPSSTYIWTFVLPMYDDLSFLHMTLGERVSRCSAEVDCLALGLNEYHDKISGIKSAKGIIEYIDKNSLNSEYAKWTRLISAIRESDSENSLLKENNTFQSRAIFEKYSKLLSTYDAGGWAATQGLLDEWSIRTRSLLVDVPYNL
ncbi:hypothetical protein [Novosphingobium sp. PhB165]|uniref:hypothetical protein n=1 Tax=Novosphingobium sp. PhB165 TaxID=2485105 RepID=UPI0010541052|nr:hypothetical protein [Novosphingobium sp. PhB165]